MKRCPTRRGRHVAPLLTCLLCLASVACDAGGSVVATPRPTQGEVPTSPAVRLLSLAVSPLALAPTFSPDVHDYVVRCGAGFNQLSFDLQTPAGSTLTVTTPADSVAGAPSSVQVTLSEDDPVVFEVAGHHAASQYWVRCLPHDFPSLTFTPHPGNGTPTPGWYLTGNTTSQTGESGFAMVLDNNGTPVWYQRGGTTGIMNLQRLPDGTLSYIAAGGPYGSDPNAAYVIQKLEPWQTRRVQTVASPTDGHELQVLPNGDVLLQSYPFVEGVDLTGLQTFGPNATIADCVIQEVSPTGDLVWSWRASDHVDPVRESMGPQVNKVDGLTVVDVFHMNSIDVDAQGNLLVSARHMDAVFYIDKASGRIVWKMGGAAYSKDGAQLVQVVDDPEGGFNYQHDARWTPDGHVTLFDDHSNGGGAARGIEYALDLGAGTATPVWQYAGPVASTAMGSFRRYADGSNLISWGLAPNNPAVVTEVDDAGNDLVDISLGADSAYRAFKVPVESLDLDVMRVTAGHS
jgi:hypothetical protein